MLSSYPWATRGTTILVILLLAAVLRLTLLGSKSLWFDEAYSVVESMESQEKIWTGEPVRIDSHPPLYYSALHYWLRVLGTSETAVRLPSALVSLVSIALLFLLAKRLFGLGVALLSAVLLAASPLDLWYAQEARMYVFMAAILLLAANLLLRPRWWTVLPLAVVLAAGLYTDYTMPALWLGLSAIWLVWWWDQGRPIASILIWLAATILAALLFSPWNATFLAWLDRFSEVTLYLRLSEATGLPALSAWQYLLLAVAGGLLIIPLARYAAVLLNQPGKRSWFTILFLAIFLLANLIFVLPRFYSVKRLLVQGWPLVILLVAWLALQSPNRLLLSTCLILFSLAMSMVILLFVEKDDWRGSVAYMNENSNAGDVVVLEHPWNLKVTRYYGLAPEMITPDKIKAASDLEENSTIRGDIWYVVERVPGQSEAATSIERWLDEHLEMLERVGFTRIEVRRYGAEGRD
jgi:uncharacterized membrane protein